MHAALLMQLQMFKNLKQLCCNMNVIRNVYFVYTIKPDFLMLGHTLLSNTYEQATNLVRRGQHRL